MKIGLWIAGMGAAGLLGLSGVARAQPGMPPAAAAGAPTDVMNEGLAPEVQQTMNLTDAQVEGFLDASAELRASGKAAAADMNADAGSAAQVAKGLAMNEQTLAIIKKHGFEDLAQFQRVGYNAAMAYGVLQQGGKAAIKEKLDKAEAQQKATMDKLRAQLSPEQMKMFEAHAGKAMGAARAMEEVPDGNLEVVKKYEDRMKNLGEE